MALFQMTLIICCSIPAANIVARAGSLGMSTAADANLNTALSHLVSDNANLDIDNSVSRRQDFGDILGGTLGGTVGISVVCTLFGPLVASSRLFFLQGGTIIANRLEDRLKKLAVPGVPTAASGGDILRNVRGISQIPVRISHPRLTAWANAWPSQ